jgi:hypothetical protein
MEIISITLRRKPEFKVGDFVLIRGTDKARQVRIVHRNPGGDYMYGMDAPVGEGIAFTHEKWILKANENRL